MSWNFQSFISEPMPKQVNLPGTEGTVINKAVPPSGDRALHFVRLKLVISPNVGDSGAQFLVGGDCVRASPILKFNQKRLKQITQFERTWMGVMPVPYSHQISRPDICSCSCTLCIYMLQ